MYSSPESIATAVSAHYACRSQQIEQLAHLFAPSLPSPQATILHGLPSTGKSSIIRSVLSSSSKDTPFAIISCKECITTRHLLERTVVDILDALVSFEEQEPDLTTTGDVTSLDVKNYTRTENLASLAVHLERLLSRRQKKFVLVFDSVDAQTENPGALLSGLVRLPEVIPTLSVVFTLVTPDPGLFHRSGISFVNFPAYTRNEALTILSQTPQLIASESVDYEPDDNTIWLWTRFTTAVWDSLASIAARDIPSFRALCEKLWPTFTQPVRDGKYKPREFSRIMVAQRAMFQSDEALVDNIAFEHQNVGGKIEREGKEEPAAPSLPAFAIYILCAAYLASYNPARFDTVYFSEWSERKKKRRRKGGVQKRKSQSQHRSITRQHLPPAPFTLARLLAVHSAVYPHPVTTATHPGTVPETHQTDILAAVATLSSARLLVRSTGGGDPLDDGARWRVVVGWDTVLRMGRKVGIEMSDWLAD